MAVSSHKGREASFSQNDTNMKRDFLRPRGFQNMQKGAKVNVNDK